MTVIVSVNCKGKAWAVACGYERGRVIFELIFKIEAYTDAILLKLIGGLTVATCNSIFIVWELGFY